MLKRDTPQAVGLHPDRWKSALQLVEGWCAQGLLPAAGLLLGRGGKTTGPHLFGKQRLGPAGPPVREDAIFLIASITKPIVATAVLRLMEQGLLALGDRVTEFLPEFGKEGKYGITVRHLLTHTSGLPDMLPNNQQLRQQHAPLTAFVEETCNVRPDFPAGRGVQYQSMGFAILGEIIHRVTGRTCAQYLQEELFEPLQMRDTALGAPASWFTGSAPKLDRVTEIRVPPEAAAASGWNWNSPYWLSLGAPWGGLLTTPSDLANFAQMLLQRGRVGEAVILSDAAVTAATSNQLADMREVPEEDRRCRPWGLGWRLNWPAHSANFGDLLGPRTFGHWGATGTVLWIDPDRDAFLIFFTTQPQEPHGTYLARLSNAVAAALL
jgi:CubicO group peptidase (beta-lactamase class C family)